MATGVIHDDLRRTSTGELVKRLSRQVSTLVRQEVELAKVELAEKATRLGAGAALLAGGALAGLATVGALTATLVLLLDLAMPAWAAALLATALWAATAVALGLAGLRKVRETGPPVPEETVESVKEDVEWIRARIR